MMGRYHIVYKEKTGIAETIKKIRKKKKGKADSLDQ